MNKNTHIKNHADEIINETGNVLWFILIAVVLLGLITMVLSRSGSNVEQSGDREQYRIKISKLTRYGKGLEFAVQDLLLKGCAENELSFENSKETGYINGNSPTDESCHIFRPKGAGLSWQGFNGTAFTGTTISEAITPAMEIANIADTGRAELSFVTRVSEGQCKEANRMSDIGWSVAGLTSDADDWDLPFSGTFTKSYDIGTGAGEAPDLSGKSTGCFIDDNDDYIFYHVILAR